MLCVCELHVRTVYVHVCMKSGCIVQGMIGYAHVHAVPALHVVSEDVCGRSAHFAR